MRKNGLLFLILACMFIPVFATEDLSDEDYITPAYGYYLKGDYIYSKDGSYWRVMGDSYESLGYYPLFSEDNYYFNSSLRYKGSFKGDIFICFTDAIQTTPPLSDCEGLGRYDSTGSFEDYEDTINLYSKGSFGAGGKFYFYYVNVHDVGGYSASNYYSLYYDIESGWASKMPIALTSEHNLSEGMISITLDSNELDGNIFYDHQNLYTLSGTFSELLFADIERTKAYPYYIDTHKGGYYDFNRNLTNDTIVKLYIEEDVNEKGIMLYYNPYREIREGYYNFTNTDSNNNPFLIQQLFSDFRWEEDFYKNFIGGTLSLPYGHYYRGVALGHGFLGTHISLSITINPFTEFKHKLTKFNSYLLTSATRNIQQSNNIHLWSYNTSHMIVNGHYNKTEGLDYMQITNSDNSNSFNLTYNPTSSSVPHYLFINLENNNLTVNYFGDENSTTETKDYFTIEKIYLYSHYSGTYIAWVYNYLYNYSSMDSISSTAYIFDSTNTSGLSKPTMSIYTQGQSNINLATIEANLYTKYSGYLSCYFNDGIDDYFLGMDTLNPNYIPTRYKLYYIHQILGQDDFHNVSMYNNSHYYCKFTYSGNVITENETILYSDDDRFYVGYDMCGSATGYYPIYYQNILDDNTEYNIKIGLCGIDKDSNSNIKLTYNVYKLNCLDYTNAKCRNWQTSELYYTQTSNYYATDTGGYTEFITITPSCYLIEYIVNIQHILENNTFSYTYIPFCYNAATTTTTPPSLEDSDIPSIEEVMLNYDIENTDVWDDPLKWFSAFIYQTFVVDNVPTKAAWFILAAFTLFWNYYFIAIMVGIIAYQKMQNFPISVIISFIVLYAFAFVNWISAFSTGILTILAFIIIFFKVKQT